jgi:hypothetical protein
VCCWSVRIAPETLGHSQCGPRDQLQSIVDLLVPELQRRGRFRTAYTGRTLRENLAG